MKIRANLGRQRAPLWPQEHQVDKVLELPSVPFASLLMQPLDRYDFIEQNRVDPHQGDGFTHCLLVLSDDRTDGVLIQCGSDGRAMYSAYVAGAKDVVQARLDRIADFIIRQGTGHTASGSWCVYCEELEEKFGVTIPEGSGLDTMLKDTLERNPEVVAVDMTSGAIETAFHPEFCKYLNAYQKEPDAFSPERTAELLNNAVTAALELYRGEELYTVLHGSFGLTIQEIREHKYFSDEELSDICGVPQQMLEGGMRVRDILQLEGVSEFASLSHRNSAVLVPLEDLKKLTRSGQEEFTSLLDARVADIRLDDGASELMLEGIEAKELERFCDALGAHEQAEQAMGPTL